MERPDNPERDDAQKAKIIFLSLAALIMILLIWSLYTANRAKTERDTARQETETLKQDNGKLEQMLKDQNQEIDALKNKLMQCEAKVKTKAKPAVKKKAPAKKSTKKKTTKKHR